MADRSTLVESWDEGTPLPAETVSATLTEGLEGLTASGDRIAVLIPDGTRTIDLRRIVPEILDLVCASGAHAHLIVALGTHQPMRPEEIGELIGVPPEAWPVRFPRATIVNHEWADPSTFVRLGEIPAERVAELSGGLLREPIPVDVNRLVADADEVLVVGPVFPHEVVGFSGGNKYLFPGVSGDRMIAMTHWLGALIGSTTLIGRPGITPVRAVIDEAASMLAPVRRCVAAVTGEGGVIRGVAIGSPEEAWRIAAGWAARTHVTYVEEPYDRALAVMPAMYADLWTGAKGMYKLDPVVADGGELVIYAPHITEFSVTHGEVLARVGFHCVDYFLAHWDRFRDEPWGVLAHSTHLRGSGSYSPEEGERCRITVTLATGISRERCEAVGLSWRDPATVDPRAFASERPDRSLVVPRAGEQLYRLRTPGAGS